jgi:hypothetical protein
MSTRDILHSSELNPALDPALASAGYMVGRTLISALLDAGASDEVVARVATELCRNVGRTSKNRSMAHFLHIPRVEEEVPLSLAEGMVTGFQDRAPLRYAADDAEARELRMEFTS